AYIYERNQGGANNWGEITILTASDAAPNDHFGTHVDIDGNVVAIGGVDNDDDGSDSGSAYIFDRNLGGANNWGELTKLTASDAQAGDRFGRSVAIAGDRLIVGAHFGDGQVVDSGATYLFNRNVGGLNNWGEVEKLTAFDGASNDDFGVRVATDGETYLVSAMFDDDACVPPDPNCDSGSAYIFQNAADLAITKSSLPTTTIPGAPITYTLTFTNSGPDMASSTILTDIVPSTIISPSFSNAGAVITPTGIVPFSWQLSDLAPGEGGIITITGIISPGLMTNTTITNTAVITNSQDITPTNNSSSAVISILIPKVNFGSPNAAISENGGTASISVTLNTPQP
ncbi:MAG: DUF11 domain-containing protein, partial [Chloroflexi bacterium]|nr:DUF11 domain-containing protein [Chloroflexota bacterium]